MILMTMACKFLAFVWFLHLSTAVEWADSGREQCEVSDVVEAGTLTRRVRWIPDGLLGTDQPHRDRAPCK